MRAFIAIDLPKETKAALAGIVGQLKKTGADVKWVNPDNIHLTLKFLGEMEEKKIKEAVTAVKEVAENKNAFILRVSSLGAFPNINSPRVIWLGIDSGDAETKVIAQELEEKIEKIGVPKEERPFSSHITIGRLRSPKNRENLVQELKRLGEEIQGDEKEFYADKITLFKSTLTPKGPIYEPVMEASLKKI
ncbi:MAG: RNA 2',3'-cyclic phosphodiesterase [Candidatus Omnitrophota bacterium]